MKWNSLVNIRTVQISFKKFFRQQHCQSLQVFVLDRHVNAVLHVNVTCFEVGSSSQEESSAFCLTSGYGVQKGRDVMGIRSVNGHTIVKQKGDDIIAIKDSCPKQEKPFVLSTIGKPFVNEA